ncbi:MAG: glutamate 5-kinase [Pseudomonadota bacterium]
MAPVTPKLQDYKRCVLKIGSSLLVNAQTGEIRKQWLAGIIADMFEILPQNADLLIVSSGSVALGRKALNIKTQTQDLPKRQAAAAVGQIVLAEAYQHVLHAHDRQGAQCLLTLQDTEQRGRHLNARAALDELLAAGIVPIINENDTVATAQVRYGDNDRLAARVATMISAEVLIVLSDVDGLYEKNPYLYPDATHVPIVTQIDKHIEAMAGGAQNAAASGGMKTKIAAARIAVMAGCAMIIAAGREDHALRNLGDGKARATWFLPTLTPQAARKRWIAGTLSPKGTLVIDHGALKALKQGRSLLPAGVSNVTGHFQRGDAVYVDDAHGNHLAIGLSAYDAKDCHAIKGQHSRDIATIVQQPGRDEMIHRDDLALL